MKSTVIKGSIWAKQNKRSHLFPPMLYFQTLSFKYSGVSTQNLLSIETFRPLSVTLLQQSNPIITETLWFWFPPPPQEIHFWNISFFKVHINYSDIYIKHKIIVLTKRNQHDLMRTFNSDETRWFFSSICFISIDVLLNYILLWK